MAFLRHFGRGSDGEGVKAMLEIAAEAGVGEDFHIFCSEEAARLRDEIDSVDECAGLAGLTSLLHFTVEGIAKDKRIVHR